MSYPMRCHSPTITSASSPSLTSGSVAVSTVTAGESQLQLSELLGAPVASPLPSDPEDAGVHPARRPPVMTRAPRVDQVRVAAVMMFLFEGRFSGRERFRQRRSR